MGFQTIGPVPGAVVECSRDLPHDASALDDAERHPAGGRNRSQCVFESRASTGGVAGGTAARCSRNAARFRGCNGDAAKLAFCST